jgi:hypothetical protein
LLRLLLCVVAVVGTFAFPLLSFCLAVCLGIIDIAENRRFRSSSLLPHLSTTFSRISIFCLVLFKSLPTLFLPLSLSSFLSNRSSIFLPVSQFESFPIPAILHSPRPVSSFPLLSFFLLRHSNLSHSIIPSFPLYSDFVLVLAGYRNLMTRMLNANLNLMSRMGNWVDFQDYNDSELLQVLLYLLSASILYFCLTNIPSLRNHRICRSRSCCRRPTATSTRAPRRQALVTLALTLSTSSSWL